ncbi:alpha/beta hydrolase [Paraburkholderia sp. USG1]|nr:alpha/beta hydrolase [Paraburkholderia sp. USG1]
MHEMKNVLAGAVFVGSALSLTTAHAQDVKDNDAPYVPTPCSAHVTEAPSNVADDQNIDPAVRQFLLPLNKDPSPFWEQPQPKPQEVLTGLQNKTPVDMSGVTISEKSLTVDGRTIKLFIMKPNHMAAHPGVILFLHGAVWLAGNFENHKRLVRDLVVESGQPAVFPEITNLPEGKFPVPLNQAYATLEWVSSHASEFGADPRRIAVAGNSVGGNMTAALNLMDKDRNGPKISYQVLLWPATNAGVDTCSYQEYANNRFLSRSFMQYGWDHYAPTEKERENPYVSPLRASTAELQGLPPTLVITEENDVLRDEGEAYAHRLQDAGVSTVFVRYNGTIHDFALLNGLRDLPATKAAIRQIADGIREHIGK